MAASSAQSTAWTVWTSRLLGIRFEFDQEADTWRIVRPDGRRFRTFEELARIADAESVRADAEQRDRADAAIRPVEALKAQLRALGLDAPEP